MPRTSARSVEPARPSLPVRLRGLVGAVSLSIAVGVLVATAIGVLLVVLVLLALTVLG